MVKLAACAARLRVWEWTKVREPTQYKSRSVAKRCVYFILYMVYVPLKSCRLNVVTKAFTLKMASINFGYSNFFMTIWTTQITHTLNIFQITSARTISKYIIALILSIITTHPVFRVFIVERLKIEVYPTMPRSYTRGGHRHLIILVHVECIESLHRLKG